MDQIRRAVVQIEQVTQTTAANAEQSAAAAEELSAQSATMKDVVNRLFAMIGDKAGANYGSSLSAISGRHSDSFSTGVGSRLARGAQTPLSSMQSTRSTSSARAGKSAVSAPAEFPLEGSFRSF